MMFIYYTSLSMVSNSQACNLCRYLVHIKGVLYSLSAIEIQNERTSQIVTPIDVSISRDDDLYIYIKCKVYIVSLDKS